MTQLVLILGISQVEKSELRELVRKNVRSRATADELLKPSPSPPVAEKGKGTAKEKSNEAGTTASSRIRKSKSSSDRNSKGDEEGVIHPDAYGTYDLG